MACGSNPNQRKVFAAIVGKLLPHLLLAAFARDSLDGSRESGDSNADGQLTAAARRQLETVLFHSIHVEGGVHPPVLQAEQKQSYTCYTSASAVQLDLNSPGHDALRIVAVRCASVAATLSCWFAQGWLQ